MDIVIFLHLLLFTLCPGTHHKCLFFHFSARVVSYMIRFCNGQKVVSKLFFCPKVVSTVDSMS